MNDYDANACAGSFSQLCDETDLSKLVSAEECQFWVYKAAMEEMIKTINAGRTDALTSMTEVPVVNRLTLH
jgi:E3 ubiquitin-protein ligase DOA10